MRRFVVWATVGSALVFMVGCATTPPETLPPLRDSEVFVSPFPKVWSALIATLAEQAYPIEAIEKESGVVTTRFVTFTGGKVDAEIDALAVKPSAPLATWMSGRYTLSIFVGKTDSLTTTVKVTSHIEAFVKPLMADVPNWVVCQSKGVIEKRLFDAIKDKLK
jgi:hypothetical protein